MEDNKTTDVWYYIIVQNPGADEKLVAFSDTETDESFVPAFKTKNDAEACFALMPKDIFSKTYEAQAIIKEDLLAAAKTEADIIYLLDETGTILKPLN